MSALGHKRTFSSVRVMSVLPLKADIRQRERHVRFVPEADVRGSAARSHMPVEYLGPRPNRARSGICAARD